MSSHHFKRKQRQKQRQNKNEEDNQNGTTIERQRRNLFKHRNESIRIKDTLDVVVIKSETKTLQLVTNIVRIMQMHEGS